MYFPKANGLFNSSDNSAGRPKLSKIKLDSVNTIRLCRKRSYGTKKASGAM